MNIFVKNLNFFPTLLYAFSPLWFPITFLCENPLKWVQIQFPFKYCIVANSHLIFEIRLKWDLKVKDDFGKRACLLCSGQHIIFCASFGFFPHLLGLFSVCTCAKCLYPCLTLLSLEAVNFICWVTALWNCFPDFLVSPGSLLSTLRQRSSHSCVYYQRNLYIFGN